MDHDEHLQHHDDIVRRLTAMLVEQRGFNERVTAAIERIDRTLAHVEITQARVETLLWRMIPHSENGRDA
jgi:hypothetical protein